MNEFFLYHMGLGWAVFVIVIYGRVVGQNEQFLHCTICDVIFLIHFVQIDSCYDFCC